LNYIIRVKESSRKEIAGHLTTRLRSDQKKNPFFVSREIRGGDGV
jgi:2-oxo-4-hydroxy-4-carboxy--5-ureidoimidazoline (OHCU) decarboxylase